MSYFSGCFVYSLELIKLVSSYGSGSVQSIFKMTGMLTLELFSTIAWWMLDLWFGLDASGFHNASMFSHHLLRQAFKFYFMLSYISPCLRTCFNGHLCMLEQYPLIDKSVHFFILLEDQIFIVFISSVLVSVCFVSCRFSNIVSHLVLDTLEYFCLRERGCCC